MKVVAGGGCRRFGQGGGGGGGGDLLGEMLGEILIKCIEKVKLDRRGNEEQRKP